MEKYISNVEFGNGKTVTNDENYIRYGKAEYLPNYTPEKQQSKKNNAYTVNQGSIVTYTIKLTNDNQDFDAEIKFARIEDTLPNGVEFLEVVKGKLLGQEGNKLILAQEEDSLIPVNGTTEIIIKVRVTEPNVSLRKLQNKATIVPEIGIKNRNDINVPDNPNDNTDSDYIQLNYGDDEGMLAGKVWSDKGQAGKSGLVYNALFDNNEELIKEVKVYLYRNGINQPIAEKETTNGKYEFCDKDIKTNVVTAEERFIKGPSSWCK